jgi:hypothetical protein
MNAGGRTPPRLRAPNPTAQIRHERLSEALPRLVFSSDGLLSIASAREEIVRTLREDHHALAHAPGVSGDHEPVRASTPLVPDMSELLNTER